MILEANMHGETNEVGLYFAMAKQAYREGYTEIGDFLRKIALDEADHAGEIMILLGQIADTRTNLERMLAGEAAAEKGKIEAASVAQREGNDAAYQFFITAAKNEKKHYAGLKKLLGRYFKNK